MTISVVGNPNDYQKIYVAVTGHETVKVNINNTSIVDEDDFIPPVDISSIRIEGVGDEFEYWWSARIHNKSKLESAEYKIDETINNNIKITIDVIASLIDVTGGANSIQIGYELFDEDGICVKSSHVYIKASHLYQKYANSVLLYNLKPGNYVLKFKDYIA